MSKTLAMRLTGDRDQLRASIDPASIKLEERTFEVVWSTGARVEAQAYIDGEGYVDFDEQLSLDAADWDLARVDNGTCPLLNTHAGYYTYDGLAGQLGRVLSVSFTRSEARAKIQFSFDPKNDGIWADVSKGVIRGVSPRYRPHGYKEITRPRDKRRVFQPVLAELKELSLCPIPKDPGGRVRSAEPIETYTVELELAEGEHAMAQPTKTNKSKADDKDQVRAGETGSGSGVDAPPADGSSGDTPDTGDGDGGTGEGDQLRASSGDRVRADRGRQSNTDTELDRVRAEERRRVEGIHDVVRSLRLEGESVTKIVRTLIDTGASLDRARSELLFERARADQSTVGASTPHAYVAAEPRDKVRAAAHNALSVRLNHAGEDGKPARLNEAGHAFRGWPLVRIAEEMVRAAGVNTRGLDPFEIVGVALTNRMPNGDEVRSAGGMHSTSDFSALLSNLAGKSLRDAYLASPSKWKLLSRRVTANDFKPITRVQLGDAPRLERVDEHGAFKQGTIGEASESYSIDTYGKVFTVTRKAIVNDDTSAFDRVPQMFGRQAAELEASKAMGLLLANPTMADGNQLISAAHANTSTGAISVASLQAALLLLAKQTGLDGSTLVGNQPTYLIAPAALQILALQTTTTITPNQSSQVNPFVGMFRDVIIDARLDVGVDGQAGDAVKWWMTADPSQVDMLEHAYLGGQEGVYLEQQVGFLVDGIQIKARHDFGVAVIDWRGFVRSTGV